MNPSQFRALIAAGKIPPVAFLVGDDAYLIGDLLEALKANIFSVSGPGILDTPESWDGQEHALADILASADQMVFGGGRKLIVVRNADRLLEDDGLWSSYVSNPSPNAVLIFCLDKLDMRRKAAKVIADGCPVVTVTEQYEDQHEAEVQRLLKRYGQLWLLPEALECLRDWVGDDLGALARELEKISVAFPDKKEIGIGDIEGIVFRRETQNVFGIIDAIVAKDRQRALNLLIRLMRDEGKGALEIFGLLRSQAEKLFLAAEMLEAGKSAQAICQALKIPSFFSGNFLAKARKMRAANPARFFGLLHEHDRAIKTGLWKESLSAELLVQKLYA